MGNSKKGFSMQLVLTISLIVLALLSFFVVAEIVSSPEFNKATIESLEETQETVMKLSVASAATSTALTMIPGDVAMPIADEIAELTNYFIVILGAITLEKILIAVVGYVSFKYIIPFACFFGILYLYVKKDILRNLAIKLLIFGIVIFLTIPASIKISDLIYASYESSITQSLETVEQNKEFIEVKKGDLSSEDSSWIEKAENYISNLNSKIGSGISAMVEKGEDTLSSFLDTIAILLITTCVIPIVVILIFVFIIKILFSFEMKGRAPIYQRRIEDTEVEIEKSKYVSW